MQFEGKVAIDNLDGMIYFVNKFHYYMWKALATRLGIYFGKENNDQFRGISNMFSLGC